MNDQVAPGWYPHPERPEEEWYWDGSAWTESRSATEPQVRKTPKGGRAGSHRNSAELVVGYIAAFVLWPVGLLIGRHLLRRNKRAHGIRVISISAAAGVLNLLSTFVIEDAAFSLLGLTGILVVLGISLVVQGHRAGGIAVTVVSLLFALLVAFQGEFEKSNQVRAQRQEQWKQEEERAQQSTEHFVACINTLPVDTCLRRQKGELSGRP